MQRTKTLLTALLALGAPCAVTGLTFQDTTATAVAQDDVPTNAEAAALLNAGDVEGAIAAYAKIREAQPGNGNAVFMLGYSLHMAGRLDEAHDMHLEATAFPAFAALAHYNHGCVHALRNEKDAAFVAIARAREAGFGNLEQLETDGDMDNLRDDARFAQLLLDLQPAGTYDGKPLTALGELPGARRFDFYLGEWDLFVEGTQEPIAVVSTSRAFDGRGVAQEVRMHESGAVASRSTYLYNEETARWKLIWFGASGAHATFEGGLDGEGGMVLTQSGGEGMGESRRQVRFSAIGADGFAYEVFTSEDGANWSPETALRYARR
jgi:hypothetical protein